MRICDIFVEKLTHGFVTPADRELSYKFTRLDGTVSVFQFVDNLTHEERRQKLDAVLHELSAAIKHWLTQELGAEGMKEQIVLCAERNAHKFANKLIKIVWGAAGLIFLVKVTCAVIMAVSK
jgi:hypothetical protein